MAGKILVVDDDYANQKVSTLFLKKLGYETDVASDGQEAILKAQQNGYSLIFMDCQMPVIDGFEATRRIRCNALLNSQTPIIALTANLMYGITDECVEAGMNDVLSKPLNMDLMDKMVKRWLNQ